MLRIFFIIFFACSAFAAGPPAVHWAYIPPIRLKMHHLTTMPKNSAIDAFLLDALHQRGWSYSVPADRVTLIRRITVDLTGLLPTPEEVEAFIADSRPDAYIRVVDRLLASPHYGERWAQHWLDVARYAESNGYEADGERPQAWRYRDWVIHALNTDIPYDRFLAAQLAGDLNAKANPDGLLASGFNRCGPIHQVGGNVDPLEVRHELLNEMTGGFATVFMGVTLGCARCHDHKFDPFSQMEYFQFEAFFSQAKPVEVNLAGPGELAAYARDQATHQAKLAVLRAKVDNIDAPYRNRIRDAKLARQSPEFRAAFFAKNRTPEQKKLVADFSALIKVSWDEILEALSPDDRAKRTELREQIHAITAKAPLPPARAWTLEEGKGPLSAKVLKRGNINRPGEEVRPRFPSILPGAADKPRDRNDLARWLTRRDHPLTARVIVNRLWQHHFGKGIVATPNDFGIKGDRPSHPELLDWLAVELIESGWSLKHLHRLMVTSNAYCQSSHGEEKTADPDNRFLSRMNRRRLDSESLRDAILTVSGQRTDWIGGPMVRIPLEPEVYDLIFTEGEPDGLWQVTPDDRQHGRRSLYLFNKRNVRQPLLEAFDQPDTLSSCPVRSVSTFAPQALILLNGPLTQNAARAMAVRLAGDTDPVDRAYRLMLGRPPTAIEAAEAAKFISQQTVFLKDELRARRSVALPEGPGDPARLAALADFCLAMMNRNGFIFLD